MQSRTLLLKSPEEDDAAVESGDLVKKDGEEVGKVTVFTYGFTLEENIGFALIETAKAKIGDNVAVCGDKEYSTVLEKRFFYDPKDLNLRQAERKSRDGKRK